MRENKLRVKIPATAESLSLSLSLLKSRFQTIIDERIHPPFIFFKLVRSGKRYRRLDYSSMSSFTRSGRYPTAMGVLDYVNNEKYS